MAAKASHVTMLQRSPSYIYSMPAKDYIANFINFILPSRLAGVINRFIKVIVNYSCVMNLLDE